MFVIGRVLPTSTGTRRWGQVAKVDTKEQAVRLAKGRAADHETRVLYANGEATFSLVELPITSDKRRQA